MDGGNLATQPTQAAEWEVYKDAFAPQPPLRRAKAWERAPVAAHAPRLQGQKIWKKVGLKTTRDDKENEDAAQLELELEGAGARKKMRIMGGKEDIRDAKWHAVHAEDLWDNITGLGSPKKIGRTSNFPGNLDALLIPRKRTNANHLITPRKSKRKTPLAELKSPSTSSTQTTSTSNGVFISKDSETEAGTMPALGLSESPKPPHDQGKDNTCKASTPQKEERRRKSLRVSSRRSMLSVEAEAEVALQLEEGVLDQRMSFPMVVLESPRGSHLNTPSSSSSLDIFGNDLTQSFAPVLKSSPAPGLKQSPLNEVTQFEAKLAKVIRPEDEGEKENIVASKEESAEGSALHIEDPILAKTVIEPSASTEDDMVGTHKRDLRLKHLILTPQKPEKFDTPTSPSRSIITPRTKRTMPKRRSARSSTRLSSTTLDDAAVSHYLPDRVDYVPIIPPLALGGKENTSLNEPTPEATKMSHERTKYLQNESSGYQDGGVLPSSASVYEPSSTIITGQEREVSYDQVILDTQFSQISSQENVNDEVVMESENLEISDAVDEPAIETPTITIENAWPSTKKSDSMVENEVADESVGLHVQYTSQHDLESASETSDGRDENLEVLEQIPVNTSTSHETSSPEPAELQGSSTPDPSTSDLVETISENAPTTSQEEDDTDMLRNFLTRVKANKAAKATAIPKRKRSLPHSPLQLLLETTVAVSSPSSPKQADNFDVSLPNPSPSKRRKRKVTSDEDELAEEPKAFRRSGRTRLPVKATIAAPSCIPVRRLGQDGDNTVTLKRNEEKELAALTRINTRKNKGNALHPAVVLARKTVEQEDPVARQRALKEVFDDKAKSKLSKKRKSVVWAEELTQFQAEEGKQEAPAKEIKESEKEVMAEEKKKKGTLKVGMRSKMSLGMAANGTPAPKRRKGRS